MRSLNRQTKENISSLGNCPLVTLRAEKKQRYKASFSFMKEWAKDLLMRENQLHQTECKIEKQLQKSLRSMQHQDHNINIQVLIKEQFIKKIQLIYKSQLQMGIEDSLDDSKK